MINELVWVEIVGIIGGIAVAVQAFLAGIITENLNVVGNALIVFSGGFLISLILLLFTRDFRFRSALDLPWYVFLAGPLGIVIITSIGYATPRIGLASTLTLIIISQLLIGVLFDHLGWIGTRQAQDFSRIAGMVLLFLGTWIVLR